MFLNLSHHFEWPHVCLLLFLIQDGERPHATAALVPSSARAGSHIRRRAVLGKGLPLHAAHRTKAVLSRVPRWGHRLSDNQVVIWLYMSIYIHTTIVWQPILVRYQPRRMKVAFSNQNCISYTQLIDWLCTPAAVCTARIARFFTGSQIRVTFPHASAFSLTRRGYSKSSLPSVWSRRGISRYIPITTALQCFRIPTVLRRYTGDIPIPTILQCSQFQRYSDVMLHETVHFPQPTQERYTNR